ncbi:hypothetical protein PTKIN_Ptkin04bG0093500 [Pterospermum kingtungense]
MSSPGKVLRFAIKPMLHHLCGPLSIPLSFILVNVLSRTTRVSNPIHSSSFRLSMSVLAQQNALIVVTYRRFTLNHSSNACILCITATAGIELADAYSLDIVIASSSKKEVHDPWAFYLHAVLLYRAFVHCKKFPTAAYHRSLGLVSVPVWLIILLDQLLIITLSIPAVVPLPRAGSYALLTYPPLETPLSIRLACVKHATSIHPEPGLNSP